jgi:hypothetical protein
MVTSAARFFLWLSLAAPDTTILLPHYGNLDPTRYHVPSEDSTHTSEAIPARQALPAK